jgi:hypothetical protein
MYDYQLFLGLCLDSAYLEKFKTVSPAVRSAFVQEHPHYLQLIDYQHKIYLGKRLESMITFSSLDYLESHIYSILRRLVADYPYQSHSLTLLAIPSLIK